MRPSSITNAGCMLCIIVVLKYQPSVASEDGETGQSLSNFAQDLAQDVPNQYHSDAEKRAMMRNMLEQHALRLKRGFNSGFAHALRVRRGGIGQRSSWGHALRVRSSNMLNRGHALRIKRKPSDYRAFALRVKKNDDEGLNGFLDESSEGQDFTEQEMNPDLEEFLNTNKYDPYLREDAGSYRQKRMNYQLRNLNDGRDMLKDYFGDQYLNSWPFPARRLRSASFAHVLRV